jgi:hypothetical protein
MGSVVGRDVTFTGNAAFHFDESLAESDTDAPFGVGKWKELVSASERSRYLELFSGW